MALIFLLLVWIKSTAKYSFPHLIEADDYYNYCESPSLLKTAITEYEPEMQRLICEYQDDVWHSDMQQSGLNPYRHSDNGEIEYRL